MPSETMKTRLRLAAREGALPPVVCECWIHTARKMAAAVAISAQTKRRISRSLLGREGAGCAPGASSLLVRGCSAPARRGDRSDVCVRRRQRGERESGQTASSGISVPFQFVYAPLPRSDERNFRRRSDVEIAL